MTNNQNDPARPKHLPRPLSVTFLALSVLTIAGFNLIRFFQTIRLWGFLSEFSTVSRPYLAASGLVWGITGLALAWGLWRGYTRAWRFAFIFTGAYSLYFWIDGWLASRNGVPTNLLFSAGLNLFLILVTIWILTRPRARIFFGERYE